ncbi:hypothetical protein Leryth_023417 [Lithospermum erythrorhizon]|nr:hypothetical protein Leryth_023417 [Lithospermum erythrorhizon]
MARFRSIVISFIQQLRTLGTKYINDVKARPNKGRQPMEERHGRDIKKCTRQWKMFQNRMAAAEQAYFEELGIEPPNSTAHKWPL